MLTVLGGTGFIGSHVLRHLQGLGHECQAPGRDDSTLFDRPLGHVIYAIGLTADFRSHPLETVEAHVCLLRRLIATGRFESLTYLSSTRVYAGVEDTRETATLHVSPHVPGDLYNISKLMGEALSLHCGRPHMKVARLSNVVGLRRDPDMFIDQLLEEGCRTGRVELRTALVSKKDYLFVEDAVALLTKIALSPEDGIFNAASGEGVANAEIAGMMETFAGVSVSVAADAPVWKFTEIDITRVKQLFGFVPLRFEEYFPAFLHSYRQRMGTE